MARYQVRIDRQASKALAGLPKKLQRQIGCRIDALADDPFPEGSQSIGSLRHGDVYRIRSGNYRIAYQVRRRVLLILVVRIAHRREFYRFLDRG